MQKRVPPAATTSNARPVNRLKAIGLMCLAVVCFSLLDASAKYLVATAQVPVTQVVWVRFLGQFAAVVIVMGLISLPRLLRTNKLKHQLFRSVLLLSSTLFNFIALRELRLDQTLTIQFMAPLLVALLAGPFLGEWVGWRRLIAIMVGFCGILVVIRPGMVPFQWGLLFALLCMAAYAAFMLVTRYLAAHDPPEVTLFYSLIAGTYFVAPLAIVDWVWPRETVTWLLICTIGLWGGLGHYLFILAYRYAPAPTVAPFLYVQIVSMTGIGYLVFGDIPDVYTLTGAGIVIASGIYLLYREQQVKGQGKG